MMTPGELKQLNEKLLKQIQGENFSVLFVLPLSCFMVNKILFKKNLMALLSVNFGIEISLHLIPT